MGRTLNIPCSMCSAKMNFEEHRTHSSTCEFIPWNFNGPVRNYHTSLSLWPGARENESHLVNDRHHLDSAGFQRLFLLLNGHLNIILDILDREKLSQQDTGLWIFRTNTFKLINNTSCWDEFRPIKLYTVRDKIWDHFLNSFSWLCYGKFPRFHHGGNYVSQVNAPPDRSLHIKPARSAMASINWMAMSVWDKTPLGTWYEKRPVGSRVLPKRWEWYDCPCPPRGAVDRICTPTQYKKGFN
jgi:hypothetical protein